MKNTNKASGQQKNIFLVYNQATKHANHLESNRVAKVRKETSAKDCERIQLEKKRRANDKIQNDRAIAKSTSNLNNETSTNEMPTIELNVDNQQISLVQADNNEEAFRRSFESSLANEPIINLQSPIPTSTTAPIASTRITSTPILVQQKIIKRKIIKRKEVKRIQAKVNKFKCFDN